jgi:hypothetical protein
VGKWKLNDDPITFLGSGAAYDLGLVLASDGVEFIVIASNTNGTSGTVLRDTWLLPGEKDVSIVSVDFAVASLNGAWLYPMALLKHQDGGQIRRYSLRIREYHLYNISVGASLINIASWRFVFKPCTPVFRPWLTRIFFFFLFFFFFFFFVRRRISTELTGNVSFYISVQPLSLKVEPQAPIFWANPGCGFSLFTYRFVALIHDESSVYVIRAPEFPLGESATYDLDLAPSLLYRASASTRISGANFYPECFLSPGGRSAALTAALTMVSKNDQSAELRLIRLEEFILHEDKCSESNNVLSESVIAQRDGSICRPVNTSVCDPETSFFNGTYCVPRITHAVPVSSAVRLSFFQARSAFSMPNSDQNIFRCTAFQSNSPLCWKPERPLERCIV